jgi:hypothetical protein
MDLHVHIALTAWDDRDHVDSMLVIVMTQKYVEHQSDQAQHRVITMMNVQVEHVEDNQFVYSLNRPSHKQKSHK